MSLVTLLAVAVLGSTPAELLALYHEGKAEQADQAVLATANELVAAQGTTAATVDGLRQLAHLAELADGGKGSAPDAGPVLVDVYACPATFECLSLADAVSGVTPAQRTVCAPSCPTVGSSTGCPNGWSCNTLLRDGGAVGHGVCAPK